jgi:hypothetical protein
MAKKLTIKGWKKIEDYWDSREDGGWIAVETDTQYTLIGKKMSIIIHRIMRKDGLWNTDFVVNGDTKRLELPKSAFGLENLYQLWDGEIDAMMINRNI